MEKHRCTLYGILALIMAMTLITASCAAATKTPTSSPNAAAGVRYGGTLKIGLPNAPTTLDSFVAGLNGASAGYAIVKTFGQAQLGWAGKNDLEPTLAPLTVKSWEVNPDGLTYILHLQEGIRWHNTPLMKGRSFTADDLVYHYARVMDPDNLNIGRITLNIKTCEAVDANTLKIVTNQKAPGFLAFLANATSVPNPKEVVTAPGGAETNWAGTGPFMLTDYAKDTKAVLKKNPDYWEPGKPYLDTVEFYFMTDTSARLAAFRSGQLDLLPMEGKTNRDNIEKTVAGAQIQEGVGMLEAGLLLNNKRTPFDKKLVRQAIQYAIDYDGVIASTLDGGGIRTGYLAPWFGEWGAKKATDLPRRDITRAKALLAEAGYPTGFKTTIMQNTGTMGYSGNAVEPVVAMLKDVGIEATIVPADTVSFTSKWRTGQYDMAVHVLLTGRPFDPDNSLRQQWMTKSSFNFLGYSNAKIDELVPAQQAAYPDREKRKPIVREILSILEDDVPSIPLYITTSYFIKQPWVKGWDNMADPQGNYATTALSGVWIDKK